MLAKIVEKCKMVQVEIFDLNKEGVQDSINQFLIQYPDAKIILVTESKLIIQYEKLIS